MLVKTMGYIDDSRWHFHYWKEREFCIGYFYKGQLEKRNIVKIYDYATLENPCYTTDNGMPIPKKVARHLVKVLAQVTNNQPQKETMQCHK